MEGSILGEVDTYGDGYSDGFCIDLNRDDNPDGVDTDDDGLIDELWDSGCVKINRNIFKESFDTFALEKWTKADRDLGVTTNFNGTERNWK